MGYCSLVVEHTPQNQQELIFVAQVKFSLSRPYKLVLLLYLYRL